MLALVRYVKAPLELVPRFPSFRAVGFNDFSRCQSALRECAEPIDGLACARATHRGAAPDIVRRNRASAARSLV
jgi:hypothetical protein